MSKKILSIIVPYYKEKSEELFPLLSSINNQVGIDYKSIECILVNDGVQNRMPVNFLKLFNNLTIRSVFMDENKGTGVARQVGIDNAIGEYVMFCDADDVLHSVAVLGVFLHEINLNKPDIIATPWLEEIYNKDTNTYTYIDHDNDITWMHGKVFRRVYLQAQNIKFHDDLRVHEDSYFLALAYAMTENIVKAPITSYIWKYSSGSITRKDDALYTYKSIPEFIRAIGLSWDVLSTTSPELMPYKAIQFIMYNYFVYQRPDWQSPDVSDYLRQAEQAFVQMIEPYLHYFENAPIDYIQQIYNQERARLFNNWIENEHLNEWLQRIIQERSKLESEKVA